MRRKVVLAAAASLLIGISAAANPVILENAKPGHKSWVPAKPARNSEIEGYASKTSVNRGEQIDLYVHTAEPSFRLEVFRMGWYSGAGARRLHGPIELPGTAQTMPQPDPVSGLVECDWKNPYTVTIPYSSDPTEWASGVYLAKLTAASGADSYIIFVVRDDARRSDLLFQSSVTTYQAYNRWGGKSLYSYNSSGGVPASRVSFNRPYHVSEGNGAGQFAYAGGWEICMLRFLEREGFDVTYSTNVDTHETPSLLWTHKAFLSVGHDEYWSWEMRDAVTTARDRGVHLGIFSANTAYWQIRLEKSGQGVPNRTIVAHKERAMLDDPFARDGDPSNDHRITTQWRKAPVSRPEASLLGVMYAASPVNGDVVVDAADHWVFAGTGLNRGSSLPGLLGYEVDAMAVESPFGTIRLAHSPFVSDGVAGYSDMTIYQAASGAYVFATGTIWWSWGLDNFNSPGARPSVLNAAAQQITRNLLVRFIDKDSPRRRTVRR